MTAHSVAPPRRSARLWVLGARPRTLGASVVPVLVGAAAAPEPVPWRVLLALVVAVALQVGVNFANDFSDGVRGVDVDRVGPPRLTATGLVEPRRVAAAAGLSLAAAAAAGAALALTTRPWLLAVGAACLLGAVLYSGGPRPYASFAAGEVAVFLFFGPVAVAGTALVAAGGVTSAAWWASVPVGLLAATLLLANNLRDLESDSAAGKRTLAVRLGRAGAARLDLLLIAAAGTTVVAGVAVRALPPPSLLSLAAAPLARPVLSVLSGGKRGAALVPALVASARLHLVAGLLLAAGLALARA